MKGKELIQVGAITNTFFRWKETIEESTTSTLAAAHFPAMPKLYP